MTWRYVGLYDFLSIFIATVTATFVLMLFVILPWGGKGGQRPINSALVGRGDSARLIQPSILRMSWVPIRRKRTFPSANWKVKR